MALIIGISEENLKSLLELLMFNNIFYFILGNFFITSLYFIEDYKKNYIFC